MQEDTDLKMNPSVVHFVDSARKVCRLIETDAPEPEMWMLQILGAIANLYAAAHDLPVPDLDETSGDPGDRFDLTQAAYWEVFLRMGPLLGEDRYYPDCSATLDLLAASEPPGIGDLADDLADIYRDIKPGLRALEHNIDEYAATNVFEWKEPLFKTHWGRHAVDAMRILHILVYR